jgi:hypothetical protein
MIPARMLRGGQRLQHKLNTCSKHLEFHYAKHIGIVFAAKNPTGLRERLTFDYYEVVLVLGALLLL